MTTEPTGPEPLTDEELSRYRDLIDLHQQYGPALSIEGETRLLAEVDRLRKELDSMTRFAEDLREERDRRLRSEGERGVERDTLAAKVEAVRDVITVKNPDWKPLTERHPEYFTPDTPEEAARKKGWQQGVDLLTQRIRAALGEDGGSGNG